jgi:hypothetical protein
LLPLIDANQNEAIDLAKAGHNDALKKLCRVNPAEVTTTSPKFAV